MFDAPVHHGHCHTHVCWHREHERRVVAYLWRKFRRHPMPWCTWAPESGTWGSQWRSSRYRARNPSSTAGGKFQILDTTWVNNGGTPYHDSHPAAVAPPLEQERIARVVLRRGGLSQWAKC